MCNYVETDLDLTQTLLGATVVHVKEDVLRLEVAMPDGSTWIARVRIEDGRFKVEKEEARSFAASPARKAPGPAGKPKVPGGVRAKASGARRRASPAKAGGRGKRS